MKVWAVLLGLLALSSVGLASQTWFQMDISSAQDERALLTAVRMTPDADFRGSYGPAALFFGVQGLSALGQNLKSLAPAASYMQQSLRPLAQPTTDEADLTVEHNMYMLWRQLPHPNSEIARTGNAQLQWAEGLAEVIRTPGLRVLTSWPKQAQLLVRVPAGAEPEDWPAYFNVAQVPRARMAPASHKALESLPAEHPLVAAFEPSAQPLAMDRFNPQVLVQNPKIRGVLEAIKGKEIRDNIEALSAINSRLASSSGAKDAERLITDFLAKNAKNFAVTRHSFDPKYSANVIARLEGAKWPEQVVIVGCHYDSRSVDINDPQMRAPGADDNGSNTANLLVLARVLQSLNVKLDYSLELHFYTAEEQGLLGSLALAEEFKTRGRKVVAMLNGDMIGWRLPETSITLGMKDKDVTDWMVSVVGAVAKLYLPDLVVAPSSSCCSDYMSWYRAGFVAVGLFENAGSASDNPNYHKSSDLPATLDYEQVEKLARAFAAVALTMAVPSA